MRLTREEALELHRQMWSEMQKELGDTSYQVDRLRFKEQWCKTHFPNELVVSNCFLCDYVEDKYPEYSCKDACPIVWPTDTGSCTGYLYMPISKILSLPEREEMENEK